MKYFLRRAEATDFDFLFRLKVVCLKEYVTAVWGWDEAFQKSHFAANFDPCDSHIIVAYGRDVGQLSVDFQLAEVHLNGIYLLPAYQGVGLGGRIIDGVLRRANVGNRPVHLQVIVGNPARRLYERLGFSVIQKTDTHFIMRWKG
jgi:GNAT superfamily N-acetyltransferase